MIFGTKHQLNQAIDVSIYYYAKKHISLQGNG
jgi:hypothetical protein